MDKFFNSTFDALTNVVPGALLLLALPMLDPSFTSFKDLLSSANQVELGGITVIVLIAYVLGFAMGPIGKWLYQKVGFTLWPINIKENSALSISDKFILVREFSPANFKYIESWNMFCTLAHNLAFSALALVVICLLRILFYTNLDTSLFIGIGALSLLLFFIFINRAVIFRTWALTDLDAAIDRLELVDRVSQELPRE